MEKFENLLNEMIGYTPTATEEKRDVYKEVLEELKGIDCDNLNNKDLGGKIIDTAIDYNFNQKDILTEIENNSESEDVLNNVLSEVSNSNRVISSMIKTNEQTKAMCEDKIETNEDFEALLNSLV